MVLCRIVGDRRVIQHCLTSYVAFQHQTGKHNLKKKKINRLLFLHFLAGAIFLHHIMQFRWSDH